MIINNNKMMKKMSVFVLIATILFSIAAVAQQDSISIYKIKSLPRDLEIELALSALPSNLRDSATVYILNPDKGFEVAVQGTNGFYAFVARTGDDAMRGNWILKNYRDDILYPISFDEAGSKAQMQVFFDIAEMQAKAMPAKDVKKIIQERYKTNYYKSPEREGISFMLSPVLRTYTNPDQNDSVVTINFPHVMYYAPNVSNQDIGSAPPKPEDVNYLMQHGKWEKSPYPFIILKGLHGYIIQARGDEERLAIDKEYETMLAKLCAINKDWCISADAKAMPVEHHH